MDEKIIRKSSFYAWMTVVTGFFTFFMIYGTSLNCMGLFTAPMSETLGVDRAVISSFLTIGGLGAIPSGIIFGRIVEKTDLKIPMAVCCFLVGLGYIINGTATSLPPFYFAAVIIGIGLAGSIQIPVSVFINGWFIKKKGVAMGLTMVGSGVGGAVLSQVIVRIIMDAGWQYAWKTVGIVTIAITIPLVLIFITKDPHLKGMIKYGENDAEEIVAAEENKASTIAGNEREMKVIFKSPEFWLLFIGLTLLTLPMVAVKAHMVAFMTDLGYSQQLAANILTITVLAVIPGKPVTGWVFDRLGSRWATAICGLCMTIGVFLLAGIPAGFIFAILFGAIYGFGSAFSSVGTPLCLRNVARTHKNFATLLSILIIGPSIAGSIGATIIGAIYDSVGSYVMAFVACAIVIGIGYICTFLAVKISKSKASVENVEMR